MITIYVLAGGELFQHVLNAVSAFMKQDSFMGLLRITALIGIVMTTVGFLKSRDPFIYARWFLGYVLFMNLVFLPKTSVLIEDISSQKPKLVGNVPVVFALSASLVTTIGYGLAQSYDALLSMPDDLQYTKTGALFGSRLIQASTDFKIVDPLLKEEMDQYFRSCVVGDIRLNRKYSVGDLATSTNLWDTISSHASPLRMTKVNGKLVPCLEAAKPKGAYSLRQKLNVEIKKAYTFYGINLFGKPEHSTYEQLFSTHLKSAFNYYQGLTDASSDIFLQSMMINAMGNGVAHYQAFTDSTASVVNHQFSKSQAQHRWGWEIAGLKALWFLPLLHTWLTILLFGVFPLIIVLATVPGGIKIIHGYLQFFLSLQFWPVMFAILNAGMTLYGSHQSGQYGQFTMVNLEKIDELHNDISGVAGYMMMLIPFLANGLVSNLGAAFSNLATSMTGHVQGSTMAVAGEAAGASFGIGQTSFYNTTANNLSANKHDSNWTHLQGMHTEQLGTGVLKTLTGSGDAVFDVSPGMTRSHVHIADTKALSASMNQSFEESKQAALNESQHYQTSLSNFAHRALSLSEMQGHDLRLGDGVSSQESAQLSKALTTMTRISEDVAQRTGVSKEDAFTALTSGGHGISGGINAQSSVVGKVFGFKGGYDAHLKYERSSNNSDRAHVGHDNHVSAQEAKDFNEARNVVSHFAKTHHFDESHSKAAQLSNQMGTDLRDAETASRNYDASQTKSMRISQSKQYVESNSDQITADLNQAFPAYVATRVGSAHRDALFAHPGDLTSVAELQGLAQDFIQDKREQLISQFGNKGMENSVDSFYQEPSHALRNKNATVGEHFQKNSTALTDGAAQLQVGINEQQKVALQGKVQGHMDVIDQKRATLQASTISTKEKRFLSFHEEDKSGKYKATEGVIPEHSVDKGMDYLKKLKEKK